MIITVSRSHKLAASNRKKLRAVFTDGLFCADYLESNQLQFSAFLSRKL